MTIGNNYGSHTSPGKLTRRLLIGIALASAVVAACAFLRVTRPADILAYVGMARECHPVWRQFAFRRFGTGDSAQKFLQRFPPSRRDEFGRYGVYEYYPGSSNGIWFTGLTVVTRDDRLLSSQAGSCTW